MTLLDRYERHATLLGKEPGNLNWAQFGEVYDDERLPRSVRENLAKAREHPHLRAANGPFRQMVDGAICLVDQTAITGTTEAPIFPVAQYAGWAPNQLRAGQKWQMTVYGTGTTPASAQGNITITPRFGLSNSGTSLGASAATALAASATNAPWILEQFLTIRTIGAAGANSNVIGYGTFQCAAALIAPATGQGFVWGSTANVAVDLSVAGGLYIGFTLGSASDSFKALDVVLESLN
jgi:hypothetical protein